MSTSQTVTPGVPPTPEHTHDASTHPQSQPESDSQPETQSTPELITYITHLKDPIDLYQRYFDALLIKRTRQNRFFRDLKLFRRQPLVVPLFQPSNPPVDQLRHTNRQITRQYLNSTYSHPWCHASNVTSPNLNSKAERRKSNYDESPVGSTAEEERLHKLLVPIWCVFRGRMNPTREQMDRFLSEERERKAITGVEQSRSGEGLVNEVQSSGRTWRLSSGPVGNSTHGLREGDEEAKAEYTDDDDSSVDSEGMPRTKKKNDQTDSKATTEEDAQAQGVGKLFVGAAAAGFFLQNKRIRKYLLKKVKK